MKETKSKKSVYSKFDDERSVAMSIIPKSDRKMKTRKLFMILLYIAYVGIWGILFIIPALQTIAAILGVFIAVSLSILIFFTWRFVKIEYELTIHMGQLGFAVIYGGLNRKNLFSCPIRDLKIIAPYNDEHRAEADSCGATETKVFVSDINSTENYYAIYEAENGTKTLLIFETEEKCRKMLKYYNSTAFRA